MKRVLVGICFLLVSQQVLSQSINLESYFQDYQEQKTDPNIALNELMSVSLEDKNTDLLDYPHIVEHFIKNDKVDRELHQVLFYFLLERMTKHKLKLGIISLKERPYRQLLRESFFKLFGRNLKNKELKMIQELHKKLPKDVKALFDEFFSKTQCEQLSDEKGKVVSANYAESPTGVEMNYALVRKKKTHHIHLVFDFPSFFEELMIDRIRECIGMANDLLYYQNQKINLHAYLKNQASKIPYEYRVSANQIDIGHDELRENSKLYSYRSSCSTIIHELLHLLGLVDTYKETTLTYDEDINGKKTTKTAYDCRAESHKSIMGKPLVFDEAIAQTLQCQCDKPKVCQKLTKLKSNELRLFFLEHFEQWLKEEFSGHINISKQIVSRRKAKEFALVFTNATKRKFQYYTARLKKGKIAFVLNRVRVNEAYIQKKAESYLEFKNKVMSKFEYFKTFVPQICPAGKFLVQTHRPGPYQRTSFDFKKSVLHVLSQVRVWDNRYQYTVLGADKKHQKKSLISAGEFSQILNGSCKKMKTQYHQCAKFAYQNGCVDRSHLPMFCQDESWLNKFEILGE